MEATIKQTQEWMDLHTDATTEEFEAKTKEFEAVSHRVFQSAYAGAGGMPNMNMPGGMGGFPGMPEGMDMSKMEEMMKNLSPEQQKQFEDMAKSGMGGSGGDSMGGVDPSAQTSADVESVVEEID